MQRFLLRIFKVGQSLIAGCRERIVEAENRLMMGEKEIIVISEERSFVGGID